MALQELYPRRELTTSQKVSLLFAGSIITAVAIGELTDDNRGYEERIETCVNELTDSQVDLSTDPDTGLLFVYANIQEEQRACMSAQGDINQAELRLES